MAPFHLVESWLFDRGENLLPDGDARQPDKMDSQGRLIRRITNSYVHNFIASDPFRSGAGFEESFRGG
jgi:hypothetical protein